MPIDAKGNGFFYVQTTNANGDVTSGSTGSSATTPIDVQQMSSIASIVGLTGAAAAITAGAIKAELIPNTQGIYLDPTGGTASSTRGLPIPVGAAYTLFGNEITSARVVQQTAGAVLNVYYSK